LPIIVPVAPTPPAVSVMPVRMNSDDTQRRLAQLEPPVKQQQMLLEQQQHRIAQLESRFVAAANEYERVKGSAHNGSIAAKPSGLQTACLAIVGPTAAF
jgi:hypothetical protein